MKITGLNTNVATSNVVKNNVKTSESIKSEKANANDVNNKVSDTVISEKATLLSEVMGKSSKSEAFTARLDALSKSIQNKTFQVDAKAIAEKLVDNKDIIKDILN